MKTMTGGGEGVTYWTIFGK